MLCGVLFWYSVVWGIILLFCCVGFYSAILLWGFILLFCCVGFYTAILLCGVLFCYSVVWGIILIFCCVEFYSDILLCWFLFWYSSVWDFILIFCCVGGYSAFLVLILLFFLFCHSIVFILKFCFVFNSAILLECYECLLIRYRRGSLHRISISIDKHQNNYCGNESSWILLNTPSYF